MLGVKGRIGRKSKVTGKSDSPKSSDIVLSPQPVSQYNPVIGQVVKESDTAPVIIEKSIVVLGCYFVVKENPAVVKEKPDVVKEKQVVVKEKPDVGKGKPRVDKHKADVVKPSNVVANKVINVVADKAINVVADKVDVAKDKINVQDDLDLKRSVKEVVKERRKTMLPKYKTNNKASSVGKSNVLAELHKDKVLDVVSKDKPKGNASSVVVSNDKRKENSKKEALFQKDKALNVVSKDKPKGNASSKLPKKKDKADIPKDKHKVHSEVPVLRSKPEVKAKASVCEDVKRKRILTKEDHSKKKPEVDYDYSSDEVMIESQKKDDYVEVKRKKKKGWFGLILSRLVDEEKLRRMLRKLKKIKEEDSSSESGLKSNKKGKKNENNSNEESGLKSNKKGKKKEKLLILEEAAHEEYLREFPTIRARTTSNSLFSAIREARVDMWSFLQRIWFSSFYNVLIDNLPSRLGRYALLKFDSETYRVTFETGDYVEVTPSKINDMLGIPIGGISLFSLDVRPIEHEFVRMWVNQFYPKSLKDIRLSDVASKVISAHQVDFLFKVNFLTLFTNTMGKVAGLKGQICLDVVRRLREDTVISEIDWCSYIYSCLEGSKILEKRSFQYLGPFTFLILLYLDSTKFDRFPVVRTRPAIKGWTTTLMRQRQNLETKEHVIGCLELHSEWTESELHDTEGFTTGSSFENSEKEVLFQKAKEKLAIICSERYFQLFKELMSFNDDDDVNGDDDGNGDDDARGDSDVNRDDDNAGSGNDNGGDGDGDGDDDVGGDGNGNGDDAGNGDDVDGIDHGDGNLNRDDYDGGCKSIEKQVDATTKENIVEEESDYITCTPESYSQWLDANSDFVIEIIDCVAAECLYGEALDAIDEDMRRNNEGTVTPERLNTRHSKASPSPNKRMVKPSLYLLSPYMNKKTKVLPKINRTEFMIGTSLFAMQHDKIISCDSV
ncbi:peptidase C48, SUMO/sentrin/Ubl1 [Tanacetum coccineum]